MATSSFTLGSVLDSVTAEICAALVQVPGVQVRLAGDMLAIAGLLNEVTAFANQPHVRQFLAALDVSQPASRKMAALAALQDMMDTKQRIWIAITVEAKTAATISQETGISYQTVIVTLARLVAEQRAEAVGKAPLSPINQRGRTATLYRATGWAWVTPTDPDDDEEADDNSNKEEENGNVD